MVGMMCSAFGATAKADACNQGGSYCALFSGTSCTDDASCKKKPCSKSLARTIKANFESLCIGVSSEKTLKMIDDGATAAIGARADQWAETTSRGKGSAKLFLVQVADQKIKKECSDSD